MLVHAQIKWISDRRHPNIVDTYTLEDSLNSTTTVLIKKHSTNNARIYASVGICWTTPVMIEKRMVFRLKDRMVIRYGVVKPLPVSFKRWKLLLVESMLDVGDALSSVAGRSWLHSFLQISVWQMLRHLSPHVDRFTHLKKVQKNGLYGPFR